MTGESELPEGEEEDAWAADGAEIGSGGPDWERSGGAKKPT